MPCHSGGWDEGPGYNAGYQQGRRDERSQGRHDSPVAELLCTTMKNLPPSIIVRLPKEVLEWWEEHLKRDANVKKQRLADAQARVNRAEGELMKAKAALKKL